MGFLHLRSLFAKFETLNYFHLYIFCEFSELRNVLLRKFHGFGKILHKGWSQCDLLHLVVIFFISLTCFLTTSSKLQINSENVLRFWGTKRQ